MGYHVVDPAELDPEPDRPSEMKYVSEAAGMDNLGLRTYRVEPGEEIPLSGLHYHDEQEEVFYVIEGTLSVETLEDLYSVEGGSVLRRRTGQRPPGAQRRRRDRGRPCRRHGRAAGERRALVRGVGTHRPHQPTTCHAREAPTPPWEATA